MAFSALESMISITSVSLNVKCTVFTDFQILLKFSASGLFLKYSKNLFSLL